MKILFLGDIVGKPGRRTVREVLPQVIEEYGPDIVIANAENIAGGKGVNRKKITEMMEVGVHVFTGGNHSFAQEKGNEVYDDDSMPVLRPANFPPGVPGKGWNIYTAANGERLLVISLLGRIFMSQHVDCPFRCLDQILKDIPSTDYDAVFVDIHAEATSEKQAIRWHVDGKVAAVVGTHTHVPTADADISENGTAFQADAGMNGSFDSCIGLKKEVVFRKLIHQLPVKFDLEDKGRMHFNGVFVETEGNRAVRIELIRSVH